MEKQRLFKMSALERDILAKALDDTQKEYHPKQAEQMRALMDKTIQAPSVSCTLTMMNSNGRYLPLILCATPICRQDGAAEGLTAFFSSC